MRTCCLTASVAALPVMMYAASAASPRVLPPGRLPDDRRLKKLRTLNDYFPFHPVNSPEEWAKRARELRRRVLVATGLWPMPPRTPLNAVVRDRREFDGYTIEKVYFESVPGFFVTGLLYRPNSPAPKGGRPGVLCPHGHWPNGRFVDAGKLGGARNVRWQIANGAERFLEGGRSPLQARCVQLARMGCLAFLYDMIGYADSIQLPHAPGMREHMNTRTDWGFFSPAAELRLQSMMGLQTWNSIRALDFLCSLPDVDQHRIAVTGASGGGTQTFILGAVDDRPALLFPAVMVSTAMQGGCTCENASYLRIDAGNVDIAALAAHPDAFRNGKPRPLGMTAADDWTREMPTKGFPDLKKLYEMLGAPERVALFAFPQFEHNYNAVSRVRMYDFLNRWFHLGFEEPVLERDYTFLTDKDLTVWTDADRPRGDQVGESFERRLVRRLTEQSEKQFQALVPADREGWNRFREIVGGGWEVIIGRTPETAGDVRLEQTAQTMAGDWLVDAWLVTNATYGEQIPAVVIEPAYWHGELVLWLTDEGKSGLFDASGGPRPAVRALLENGCAVAGIDMLYQGEFLKTGRRISKQRMVGGGKALYAGYTFGYNPPLFCRRVHDVLTALAAAGRAPEPPQTVVVVGQGRVAGPIAAAARAVAGASIAVAAVDARGFVFNDLDRIDDPMFVPGSVKYGDVPGLLALSAPRPLIVVTGQGTEQDLSLPKRVYAAVEAGDAFETVQPGPEETAASALAAALLRRLR